MVEEVLLVYPTNITKDASGETVVVILVADMFTIPKALYGTTEYA